MIDDLVKALIEVEDALAIIESNRKAKPCQWRAAFNARDNAAYALAVIDADAALQITGMHYA